MSGHVWILWLLVPMFIFSARRRAWWRPYRSQSVSSDRLIEELQGRLAEIDQLQSRVAELESRLDFTERIVMERRAAAELAPIGSPKS